MEARINCLVNVALCTCWCLCPKVNNRSRTEDAGAYGACQCRLADIFLLFPCTVQQNYKYQGECTENQYQVEMFREVCKWEPGNGIVFLFRQERDEEACTEKCQRDSDAKSQRDIGMIQCISSHQCQQQNGHVEPSCVVGAIEGIKCAV